MKGMKPVCLLALSAVLAFQSGAYARRSALAARKPAGLAGDYTYGTGQSDHVLVRARRDGTYSADISATFSHNSGGSGGNFKVVNGYGVISPDGCNRCEFLLWFKGNRLMVIQEGDNEALCGMGNGVSATAVYTRGNHKGEPILRSKIWSQGPVSYLNAHGKVVLGPYAGGETFSEGMAAVQNQSKKWGFIDPDGKLVIPYRYDRADVFKHGLAAVSVNDKWGYITKDGKVVGKLAYWKANQYSPEGIAKVTIDNSGQSHYIDIEGARIDNGKYYSCKDFSGGMGVVSDGSKYGAVDNKGKETIPLEYTALGQFHEGLASFQEGAYDKFGYIDKTGTVKIEPAFDDAGSFSEGLARVRMGDRWGYIDRTGKVAIAPAFVTAPGDFSEGLAVARPARSPFWQIIDKSGKRVADMPFGYHISGGETRFRDGVIVCKFVQWNGLGGSTRYFPIDKTGRILPGFAPESSPPVGMFNFSDGLIITRNTDI
ncbi:MAG: WG repeat-containing protein [Cyanobacteria bacterium HKST-UBA02]|nr:WG repeat-containing protein [Cyanobacteria bacterium HKST-UBA02]